MSEGSGTWDISHLADLIIGPNPHESDPSTSTAQNDPQESEQRSEREPRGSGTALHAVAIVPPASEPVSALRHYANYWSNRGQRTAVIRPTAREVSLEWFDCRGRGPWFERVETGARRQQIDELAAAVHEIADRIAVVVSVHSESCASTLQAVGRSCILVQPQPEELIRGYEVLKRSRAMHGSTELSCFVVNCDYADDAQRLASKLNQMGQRFLNAPVAHDGFNIRRKWVSDNLVGHVQLPAAVLGGPDAYLNWVRACLGAEAAAKLTSIRPVYSISAPRDVYARPDSISNSVFPSLKALRVRGPVASSAQLDLVVAESLHEIVEDAVSSWPIDPHPQKECCFRFVRRRAGARGLIVSAVQCPAGGMEKALALLYPHKPTDRLVMLSAALSLEHIQAASAFGAKVTLYEISCTPPCLASALCLREVPQHAVINPASSPAAAACAG